MIGETFETASVRMERMLTVTVACPEEDAQRIVDRVREITPLRQGPYDGNAFVSPCGTELYRPLEGAAAGAETEPRRRPGVVEVTFDLPHDAALLEAVVEAVFLVHSYQEPVIRVRDNLVARSRGLDDRDNPHRWWNTTGDWKRSEPSDGP